MAQYIKKPIFAISLVMFLAVACNGPINNNQSTISPQTARNNDNPIQADDEVMFTGIIEAFDNQLPTD